MTVYCDNKYMNGGRQTVKMKDLTEGDVFLNFGIVLMKIDDDGGFNAVRLTTGGLYKFRDDIPVEKIDGYFNTV